jgi:hypothetical protein
MVRPWGPDQQASSRHTRRALVLTNSDSNCRARGSSVCGAFAGLGYGQCWNSTNGLHRQRIAFMAVMLCTGFC